jgi:xanthine dehydrogenase YagS FAD-binding subunit
MQAFEYASPTTVQEALSLLGSSWNDAQVLAGGTDLISLMKDYVESPKRVVNIKGIKELGGISKTTNGLRIGATVTVEDLMNNAAVRSEYPSLLQAARGIRSPQIRNMGTVGGDLTQRPRSC